MASSFTPIEKLDVTQKFEDLPDRIWDLVQSWPRFAQSTVGEQLLRAADSVAANIVEGGNREGDPDALRFFGYARGSAAETAYWLRRALKRGLLDQHVGGDVYAEWETAQNMLGRLISYRRSTKWKVREVRKGYGTRPVNSKVGAKSTKKT